MHTCWLSGFFCFPLGKRQVSRPDAPQSLQGFSSHSCYPRCLLVRHSQPFQNAAPSSHLWLRVWHLRQHLVGSVQHFREVYAKVSMHADLKYSTALRVQIGFLLAAGISLSSFR